MVWCAAVERQPVQLAWLEEMMASAAVDCFRETASAWFKVLGVEKPDAVKQWKTFKPHLMNQFGSHKTPAQQTGMLADLKQKDGEDVIAFYDRCANTYYEVMEDNLAVIDGDDKDSVIKGFEMARNELLKLPLSLIHI